MAIQAVRYLITTLRKDNFLCMCHSVCVTVHVYMPSYVRKKRSTQVKPYNNIVQLLINYLVGVQGSQLLGFPKIS